MYRMALLSKPGSEASFLFKTNITSYGGPLVLAEEYEGPASW
jgi:hypothetical protein